MFSTSRAVIVGGYPGYIPGFGRWMDMDLAAGNPPLWPRGEGESSETSSAWCPRLFHVAPAERRRDRPSGRGAKPPRRQRQTTIFSQSYWKYVSFEFDR